MGRCGCGLVGRIAVVGWVSLVWGGCFGGGDYSQQGKVDNDIEDYDGDLYCENGKCTMRWVVSDYCDDDIMPYLEFYDPQKKESWGIYRFQRYANQLQRTILCDEGHEICFGAWGSGEHWGCGEDCAFDCGPDLCCVSCRAQVVHKYLYCEDGPYSDLGGGNLYCAEGECRMRWVFNDSCRDQLRTMVELYDMDDGTRWEPFWLDQFDVDVAVELTCTKGHKLCFGAWADDSYWGCGEDCTYNCDSCCYECDSSRFKTTLVCED